MLSIYHWEPNANSGKPILAAFEKGVEFESHYVDMLNFEQHEPGYIEINRNGTLPELLSDSHRKIAMSASRIEQALAASPWLVGEQYSLADIDAFAISHSLTSLAPEHVNAVETPRMMAWLDRIRERPAVRAALSASRTGRPECAFAPGPEHSRWG